MNNNFNFNFEKFEKILTGDLSEVRKRMRLASEFLMVFEMFKVHIGYRVRDFYCTVSCNEEYKELEKQNGKGKAGKHKNKPFRTSMRFFCDHDIITEEEFQKIEYFYKLRNDVGHELLRMLTYGNSDYVKKEDILELLNIYKRIHCWWCEEFEAKIQPELFANYKKGESPPPESPTINLIELILKEYI